MSLYDETVPIFSKQLAAIDGWLQKAAAHAAAKKFEPSVLLEARLAPDMFPLSRQVQAACDQTKFGVARIAGKEPPKTPDTEKTLEELRARIETARGYLATYTRADFEGAEKRAIPLFFAPGKAMLAANFLREYVGPNFYFHATVAYAILRHNGVDLGKRDFIGHVTMQDA